MDRFNGKLMLDELGTDLSVTLLGVAGLGLEMEEGTIGSFLLDFSSDLPRFFFLSFFLVISIGLTSSSCFTKELPSLFDLGSGFRFTEEEFEVSFKMEVDVRTKDLLLTFDFDFFGDLPLSGASSWNLTILFSFGLSEVSSNANIWFKFSNDEFLLLNRN